MVPGSCSTGASCPRMRQEQGRPDERERVDDERDRRLEELDEHAGDRGPADARQRSAAVEERVRLDVLLALRDRTNREFQAMSKMTDSAR